MDDVRRVLYEKLERFWSKKEPGHFHVCYSGGLDSTVVAYIMAKKYTGDIFLYTMHHNYGSLFVGLSRRHVFDLERLFGKERVHHVIHNQTETWNTITGRTLCKDWRPYGGHVIWCLGCFLSMMTNVIISCLIHSIPRNFLCSSVGGEYAVMSMPVARQAMGEIYWDYGIDYRTPLLEMEMDKKAERALMQDAGLWIGYRFRRGVHGVQPICIPSFQHLGDVFFDLHTEYSADGVRRYVLDKRPIVDRIVREHIEAKGLDLAELIEKNKAQHTRDRAFDHIEETSSPDA